MGSGECIIPVADNSTMGILCVGEELVKLHWSFRMGFGLMVTLGVV
jgi:hypothetical protein